MILGCINLRMMHECKDLSHSIGSSFLCILTSWSKQASPYVESNLKVTHLNLSLQCFLISITVKYVNDFDDISTAHH